MKDSVVESIIKQFQERSEVGIKKYNTTLDRTDLTDLEWMEHLKQELMDAILYLQRLQNEFEYVKKKMNEYEKEKHNLTKRRAWHY